MSRHCLLKIETLLVFVIGIFCFTYGLFAHVEFVQFEARFALFAKEMLRHGISFFPTTYDLPYPDYPATQTILIYLLATLFNSGKLTILIAVLPNAIAAALILVLTYKLAAVHNRFWGIGAVLCELGSYGFFAAARSLSPDIFVALATIWAFYAAYRARYWQTTWRYWGISSAFGFGFMFHGPLGLLIPASVVLLFFTLEADWKKVWSTALLVGSLLSVGVILLFLAAWYQGGIVFAQHVLQIQVWHHLIATNKAVMPFYYLLNALANYAIAFPLACLLIGALSKQFWHKTLTAELTLLRHAAAWIFIVFISMSIQDAPKIRHVMPMLPAAALIAGYLFTMEQPANWLIRLRHGITRICYSLPLFSLPIVPATLIVAQMKGLTIHTHALVALALLVLTLLVTLGIGYKIHRQPQRDLSLLACGVFIFMVQAIFIVEPLNISTDQALPFVTEVLQKRIATQAIIFYQITAEDEAIKFMAALDKPLQPLFAQTPAQISHYAPAIIIAKQTDFADLPNDVKNRANILVQGKIGHRACVAFSLED